MLFGRGWWFGKGRSREHGTRARGAWGEAVARQYLERQGLTFRAANWSCRFGEIDLVMDDADGTRVLVEVRLRARADWGGAAASVGRTKQERLVRTARLYQQREDYWGAMRFDVVAVEGSDGQAVAIEHIRHAFEVS